MSSSSSDRFRDPRVRRARPWIISAVLMVIAAISAVSYVSLTSYLVRSEERLTPPRAAFFASAMDEALSRLEHLPFVIANDPTTLATLVSGNGERLSPVLREIATRARAEFVYVLDLDGKTIASSNYLDADSLVGKFYTFRPYFRDAVNGGNGRFYAVGVTTGRPGYFIAEPVRDNNGEIFGVVAVKIGIADLSRELTDSGELVFVTNQQGVVLASSDATLNYGFLSPMSRDDLAALEEQQQFGDETLFPLDWTSEQINRARLRGTTYIWTRIALGQEDWTLHLLSGVGDLRRQALTYVAFGLMALLALIVAGAIYRTTQLRNALAVSDADRRRLATEIEDRKIAEARLEAAQSELNRKNQLAALGQLSASITHELGQPISAMRNYLVAEEIATGAAPGGMWPELTGLVDRMQRILNQLRLFGRSHLDVAEAFDVQSTVKAALGLVRHTAQQAQVTLRVDLPDDPVTLSGQSGRFEQVIVNLLRNAIDAVEDRTDGAVHLTLTTTHEATILRVTDNGPGLGDLDITDLREPFFSTKPSGKGMGLGLAISAQIVNEMGGNLLAQDQPDQGAAFSVIFPTPEHHND